MGISNSAVLTTALLFKFPLCFLSVEIFSYLKSVVKQSHRMSGLMTGAYPGLQLMALWGWLFVEK
jgi:hypothetical protein